MKLSTLVSIRQGYQFRKKAEFIADEEIKVIQMADTIDNQFIDYKNLPTIRFEATLQKNLLKKNDIIFCTRGNHNYNIFINNDIDKTIVVSQFLIIQVIDYNKILPEYLSWFLNQPIAISYFKSNRLTGAVPLIKKQTLCDLEIQLPPISIQVKIAAINSLLIEEGILQKKIQSKKEKMINQILQESINSNNDNNNEFK